MRESELLVTSYHASNDVCNGGLAADTAAHEPQRGSGIVLNERLYLQPLLSQAVMSPRHL